MNFLNFWNKFFFIPKYNIFDVCTFVLVVNLIATGSWWWALLYIPAAMISVLMQMRVEADNANS
jgi:hypothetical protein